MSKVLVDRELLERIERCYMDGMSIYGECEVIRAILAQPAEAEGVGKWSELKKLAEKATPGPWWVDSHGHRVSTEDGMQTVFIAADKMGPATRHPETGNLSHWPNDWDASYIVNASPDKILELIAALSAVTAERDRLESMLIRTTTRHFAQQWKDRADDKKLDECLSEGIAMLEAERDRLRAVLEGAQYPNIDRLKTLTIEQCRQVGETVMRLTIDAQSERDQLRAEVDRLRNELAGKPLVC